MTDAELAALPASAVFGSDPASPSALAEVQRLRSVYMGSVGYELLHLPDPEERAWLREAIESGRYTQPLSPERRRALLERLSQVQGFENFLHRAFNGQKRFSIEGTDAMVPMLDEIIAEAAAAGADDVLIGMAHRGRLNVLANVLRKPAEMMLAGFKAAQDSGGNDAAAQNSDEPSGDVKYHMGWEDEREVGGRTGARAPVSQPQPPGVREPRGGGDDARRAGRHVAGPARRGWTRARAIGVLIHGDAAFPGQGTVPETFNMQSLPGYAVGGTLHIIANNQVGFTTDPQQGRSTRYSSDLAKGFEVPVVHVNADDAEACLGVARLAHAYRRRWGKDFVIDLVGYRRWGHNEGDEPLFTQPVMYERIKGHPTARAVLAERLVAGRRRVAGRGGRAPAAGDGRAGPRAGRAGQGPAPWGRRLLAQRQGRPRVRRAARAAAGAERGPAGASGRLHAESTAGEDAAAPRARRGTGSRTSTGGTRRRWRSRRCWRRARPCG